MAKKMLEARELGKVVLIEGHIAHRGGMSLTPQTWRWYRDRCPGGPLVQLAIHTADTFNYLVGPVRSVCAKVARLATPAEIDDTGVISIEYESGTLGYIGTAYTVPGSNFTFIHGTEASIFFDREAEEFKVRHKTGKTETRPTVVSVNPLTEELDEFAKCSMLGTQPETGGPEGLNALAVIVGAMKSSREGRTVTIAEVLAE
jgi:predicted dehydrogenase